MSFPAYPGYKDSGVDWLGHIPEGWSIKPLWALFRRHKLTGFSDEQLLSVYRDYGVIPKASRDDNFNKPSDDLGAYQLVQVGDLAINKMKAWQGSVGISSYKGIVSPAYHVYAPSHSESPQYLHHLFRCNEYIAGYLANSKGIRVNQWDLEPQQHSRMSVLLPPLQEQIQIARFLDHETARIDVLIEEQQRLIELLKEKRQALLSHAVTKGLDPSVPMKDSGVEWLDEVPAHWSVVPFGLAFGYQEGPGIMAVDFRDEGVPLVRISGVQGRWVTLQGCNYLDPAKASGKWGHFRLEYGDLIISGSASMGLVSEVGEEAVGAVAYTGLIRLTPKTDISNRDFIRSVVSSHQFFVQIDLLKAGSTIQHFGPTHLSQMKVVLPPLNEQIKLASYVDKVSVQFDQLLGEAKKTNELLQERRSALISAAVTGKIDVRGWLLPASGSTSELAQEAV